MLEKIEAEFKSFSPLFRVTFYVLFCIYLSTWLFSIHLANVQKQAGLEPVLPIMAKDSEEYRGLIESVLDGEGLSEDGKVSTLRTPGYMFFAATIKMVGKSYFVVTLIQIILVFLSAILIRRLGLFFVNNKVGEIAAFVFLLNPVTLVLALVILTDILFLFVFMYGFYLAVTVQNDTNKRIIFASILFALAIYIRPMGAFALPIFATPFLLSEMNLKNKLKALLLMVVIIFLLMVPWMIRNYKLTGVFDFTSFKAINLAGYAVPQFLANFNNSSVEQEKVKIENQLGITRDKWRDITYSKEIASAMQKIILEQPVSYLKFHTLSSLPFLFSSSLQYLTESYDSALHIKKEFKPGVIRYLLAKDWKMFVNGLYSEWWKFGERIVWIFVYLLALLGWWQNKKRLFAWGLLFIPAYLMLLSGPAANARYALQALPFVLLLFAGGLIYLKDNLIKIVSNNKKVIESLFLLVIFFVATAVNILPWFLSGIPLSKQLSSDAEYHIVHWYEYSKNYEGNFLEDKSFKLDARPAGDLFMDKVFVKIGDFFNINLLNLSILISIIALFIFLSGVYVLGRFIFNDSFWAFILSLGSIIPTFALGGTTWGFVTLGYLPRELALGFCVWLLFLFLYGKKNNISKLSYIIFFVSGLLANWYPVSFIHFVLVLLLTDIIQKRKIAKEHFLYGLLFFGGASFAVFDIVRKAQLTTPPDLDILRLRYGYMFVSSFDYGVLHYLRRIILYLVWVPLLIFIYRKFLKDKIKENISFWISMFISSGIIMTIGVFLEEYTVYAKFLFSRTSLFFILSSMVISTMVLVGSHEHFFPNGKFKKIIIGLVLFVIFLGQSAIPTIYRSFRDLAKNANEQKIFLNALDLLGKHTTSKDMVLADPKYSNKIRAYALRPVYSSWKDGGISLLDGSAGREWYNRYIENYKILQTKDLNQILKFSKDNKLGAIFVKTGEVNKDPSLKGRFRHYQVGSYEIFLLNK